MSRILTAAMVGLFIAGCSSAAAPPSGPAPEAEPEVSPIDRLEARRNEDPTDPRLALELAAAYRQAGDLERARSVLDEAVTLPNAPPAAWARLGAVAELQEDWEAAESAYGEYIARGGPDARSTAEPRLHYIRRQRMAAEAQRLLEREAELSAEDADPSVVAVMPLLVEGPPEYEALGRGIAEMLTTDLSMTERLRVVERAQLHALLTEMRLSLGGYVDPETAARTGVLTRAGRVVQGLIPDPSGGDFSLQATVVAARTPDERVRVERSGPLEQLFDVEAELALALYQELGVQLTSAEIARIREHPTSNVQAFLAYSQGLRSMDRGDFDQARQHFQQATDLDPGFGDAVEQQQAASSLSTAAATAPDDVGGDEGAEDTDVAVAEEDTPDEEPDSDPGTDDGDAGTSSTMEGLAGSTGNAGAGAATETTTAAAPPPGAGGEDGETAGAGTGGETGPSGSDPPPTRGEGVMVDRLVEWTLTRPRPLLWIWP